ncbi:MAG TPA: VCBS repeat-containing protein [Euzebyales bacterium]|nr:VCBS repeat-containing protein [Euzebyales bacterium]
MSTGVMIGLTVLILGTLGVLYVVNTRDVQSLSAPAPASEAATGTTVPVAPDELGSTPAGQDVDGDGDTAADSESAVDGDAPTTGTAGDGGTGIADDAGGTGGAMPGREDGRGLFSPDDPGRVPTITVSSTPRDVHVVQVDLDGDGVNERVWAAIVRDQTETRVEQVVDGRWTPMEAHSGPAADRLVELRVRDLTGDGRPEVYTRQWVATQGESLTIWSYRDGALARMRMSGGCYNNANTVGITGALVEEVDEDGATIAAICRDDGLPPQQWSSAIYVWRDGRWLFGRQQGRYVGRSP